MSLTGANSVLQLGVPGLYNTPQQLQQFMTDDVFSSEVVKRIETAMGVDGVLSGGFVFNERKMVIALQANSPSLILFWNWIAAEEAATDTLPGNLTVLLPSIKAKFACTKGFLTDAPPIPDVKKLLQGQKFTLAFQSITPAPM